jgi:hypothetical protein
MFFYGTPGGNFNLVTGQANVFEVGSNVGYSYVLSGINVNNKFVVTGSTGQIINYGGITNLNGYFLSGTSNGFVLAPISDIKASGGTGGDSTFVQPGLNTYTAGTASNPSVNISAATLNYLSATSISAVTYYGDGSHLSGVSTSYTNSNPSAIAVGGIQVGTTFSSVTTSQMFDLMLYPELFPTLTNPSSSFSLTQSGLREIGEVVTILNFIAAFSRGSISPPYTTSGYRSGLPNTYVYVGTGLSSTTTTNLTDSKTVSSYTVLNGVQSWTCGVMYDAGEQPKSSKGNNYSSPLPSGTTSISTQTITGVYPVFATTVLISTMTKQTLVLMNSTYIGVTMVAEDDSNKEKIDFPIVWSPITGIQFYNTVSSAWEWIGGTKANSLLTFDITSVTNVIQGNIINYNRYTNNGAKIGSRQLRFYTN